MAQRTGPWKSALLLAAAASQLPGRPRAEGLQASPGAANGTWEAEEDTSTTSTPQPSPTATTTTAGTSPAWRPSMTSSLGRSTTVWASHYVVVLRTTSTSRTVRTGEAGRQEEDDGPSTSTRAAAVLADSGHLFVVPLMLAGLGLFHKCFSCGAGSVEEATRAVAFKLWCGINLVLFPLALVAFVLVQGFPLPRGMCIWKMPLFSETPCDIFGNQGTWETFFWSWLNLSYNLLALAMLISLFLVGAGAVCCVLCCPLICDPDGWCEPCKILALSLVAAAALVAMAVLSFPVALGFAVFVMLSFTFWCVAPVSIVLWSFAAFYAAMVRSSRRALRGSASVATGWRRLQQLAMVPLAWVGGSVGFVTDLCNVTTSLQAWLQGGCGSQVGCEAFSVVGEWLLQAFPWLPKAVPWLFMEYQQIFDFAYRAARWFGMLLQLECGGLQGFLLTYLLGTGMISIYLMQAWGTTEALARLRTHTELAPRIHTFVLLGTCQFISTRITELCITMGNGAFIHAVTYSAAFLVEQPGSNPACVSGPAGLLGVISLLFLWSVTVLSLYYLFGLVFTVQAEERSLHDSMDKLSRNLQAAVLTSRELWRRGLWRNSIENFSVRVQASLGLWHNSIDSLGAAALTSLGLWHDQEWCGSNMKLLKIEETVARLQVEEAAVPGWSRVLAKNLMLARADFLSTSLMVLPLGVVLGKFTQCSNAGSVLARTSLPLPENGRRKHLQKLLALLRFSLLLLIPLVPTSDAPSFLVAGVALVGLEALLEVELCGCFGVAAKVEPCQ